MRRQSQRIPQLLQAIATMPRDTIVRMTEHHIASIVIASGVGAGMSLAKSLIVCGKLWKRIP